MSHYRSAMRLASVTRFSALLLRVDAAELCLLLTSVVNMLCCVRRLFSAELVGADQPYTLLTGVD